MASAGSVKANKGPFLEPGVVGVDGVDLGVVGELCIKFDYNLSQTDGLIFLCLRSFTANIVEWIFIIQPLHS